MRRRCHLRQTLEPQWFESYTPLAMSVKIVWSPSTNPNIASYDIEKSAAQGGPFVFLINIAHVIPGPNYNDVTLSFFHVDVAGTLSDWYRLIAIDALNNRSVPSAPIHPVSSVPTFTNTVSVDHNYGSPGALRYQTASGAPVEGALIRVYEKTLFDQGLTATPLAVTLTDVNGNWVNPISLTTGKTYTVQFAKEGLYGPDKTEIIV